MAKGEFDFKRLEITAETRAWLDAESRITGKKPQKIVRELLHERALKEIAAARLLTALAGTAGTSADAAGQVDEDQS